MFLQQLIKYQGLPRKEREACKNEVELLKRLNHPNIVGYHDCFEHGDRLCIVMEYAGGGDILAKINRYRKK